LTGAAFASGAGILQLVFFDNAQYSSDDVTGDWITLKTISISNAQAQNSKLFVEFACNESVTAGGAETAQGEARIAVDSTQIGQKYTGVCAGNGYDNNVYSGNCLATLVAGTNYTQGTGFSILLQVKGTKNGATASVTNRINGIVIFGVI